MDFEQEKAETRGAHGKGAAPRSAFGSTLLRIRREVASISGRKVQELGSGPPGPFPKIC